MKPIREFRVTMTFQVLQGSRSLFSYDVAVQTSNPHWVDQLDTTIRVPATMLWVGDEYERALGALREQRSQYETDAEPEIDSLMGRTLSGDVPDRPNAQWHFYVRSVRFMNPAHSDPKDTRLAEAPDVSLTPWQRYNTLVADYVNARLRGRGWNDLSSAHLIAVPVMDSHAGTRFEIYSPKAKSVFVDTKRVKPLEDPRQDGLVLLQLASTQSVEWAPLYCRLAQVFSRFNLEDFNLEGSVVIPLARFNAEE